MNFVFLNSKTAIVKIPTTFFTGEITEIEQYAEKIGQYGNVLSYTIKKGEPTTTVIYKLSKDALEFSKTKQAYGGEFDDLVDDTEEYFGVVLDDLGGTQEDNYEDWWGEFDENVSEMLVRQMYPVWSESLAEVQRTKDPKDSDYWDDIGERIQSASPYSQKDSSDYNDMCINLSEDFNISWGAAVYIIEQGFPTMYDLFQKLTSGQLAQTGQQGQAPSTEAAPQNAPAGYSETAPATTNPTTNPTSMSNMPNMTNMMAQALNPFMSMTGMSGK